MRVTLTIALSGLLATSPAYATTLDINVEVPKLNVAEYHRPYVAVWLEGADQKVAANLSVWYQQTGNSEGHGTKWLPDLRHHWRRSGSHLVPWPSAVSFIWYQTARFVATFWSAPSIQIAT